MCTARSALVIVCVALSACGPEKFAWAFAQDLDGSIRQNETCRQSLAESVYRSSNTPTPDGAPNVFTIVGQVESYRVFAFHSRSECDAVLAGFKRTRSRR